MEHLITLTDEERAAMQAMRDELAEETRQFDDWLRQPIADDYNANRWRPRHE